MLLKKVLYALALPFFCVSIAFASAPTAYVFKDADWQLTYTIPTQAGWYLYDYTANIPLVSAPGTLNLGISSLEPPEFYSQSPSNSAGGVDHFISFSLPPHNPAFPTDTSGYSFLTISNSTSNLPLSMILYVEQWDSLQCFDGNRNVPIVSEYTRVNTSGNFQCANTSTIGAAVQVLLINIRFGDPESFRFQITYDSGPLPVETVRLSPSQYPHDGCAKPIAQQNAHTFAIKCFDNGLNVPVGICFYHVQFPNQKTAALSSGHDHGLPPMTGNTFIPGYTIPSGAGVYTEGTSFVYEPPEIALDVTLQITGEAFPIGSTNSTAIPVEGATTTYFSVSEPGSVPDDKSNGWGTLVRSFIKVIDGADDNPSHSLGFYGSTDMETAIDNMGPTFKANVLAIPIDPRMPIPNIVPILRSQAASLPHGGLYDWHKNWTTPHCGHRDGGTIDISLTGLDPNSEQTKPLTFVQIEALESAILSSGLAFYVVTESPTCTENPNLPQCLNEYNEPNPPDHWHVQLRKKQ
jgi:hypothetical protein